MKKTIILWIIGVCIVFLLCYRFVPLVILPVNSSKHTLTLVSYGGPHMKSVILKHYISGEHIRNYVLDLIIEPRCQQPQTYELPELDDGSIQIVVVCYDNEDFSVTYQDACDLYTNGLLIYTSSDLSTTIENNGVVDYDTYIYFKSGKAQTVFSNKVGEEAWLHNQNPPRLKKFIREEMGYSPLYYGWRENQWVITSDN